MEVRCSFFELLLFQMLVAWCGAKHVAIPSVEVVSDLEKDVQDSIKNLIHTGIYSHQHLDTSQTHVVHPVKVTHSGELISRAVDHEHAHGHARARRDLYMRDHEMPHELHYNISLAGKEMRLDLRPSVTFITPGMVVERHRVAQRTRAKPHSGATACHYTGSIRDQPGSTVALSACDGLTGLLLTEDGEYWIEPSTHQHQDSSAPRPHVVFKRSAVDKLAAYHRTKRAVDRNNTNNNISREQRRKQMANARKMRNDAVIQRKQKEAKDKRRREYLEKRRRRLEALRNNPTEYRRQQKRLRLEQRRNNFSKSVSRSMSVEGSVSTSDSAERINFNQNRMNKARSERINFNQNRMNKTRSERLRRKRRTTNCATKQPPYQWKTKNTMRDAAMRRARYMNPKDRREYMERLTHRAGSRRAPRSVSRPQHVEVLVVADKSMTHFHNKSSENLETYVLAIMNIVQRLYKDASIGNYIKVVVVKIIILEEKGASNLEVSTNADSTLNTFCKWQHDQNPEDDENPHHHDVAILITRQDICSQQDIPCSTLGVAHVAGMCKPDRSCSVNEDNGISLAHTITHELGHNFGLYHDTTKIGCTNREGDTLHIMTPVFESDTSQVSWSTCSKRDITNFLDAGLGECLSDKPSQEEYTYPEVPAGVTYDATAQCHLQFGPDAEVCTDPYTLCMYLWCNVNGTCTTMTRPAAPGTTCGHNMWCQNRECVPRTTLPTPVNGGWGPWSEWSECSRTCGAGVSTKTRDCDSPAPENNGVYCIGPRSQYKVCNTEPCSINELSFREVQCAKFKTNKNGTTTDLVPYFDQDRPCDLLCMPRIGDDAEDNKGFAADGTPCRQSPGSRDMCIAGVCYKVGCDWIVDSDKEEDACGMCGGNGSSCKTVQGIYTKDTTKKTEFSLVAEIPAGSRNVKIQEKASPGNFISIKSAKANKMYLHGAQSARRTEYFVAGAPAVYERNRDWEKVRISGPIVEDIKIYQRLNSGHLRNPGVTYQYTVDSKGIGRGALSYRLTPWTPCSASCGDGYIMRRYECYDEHDRVVDISQCYHMESPRNVALIRRCRAQPCRPRAPPAPAYASTARTHWWTGEWKKCGMPCHKPEKEATKRRSVYCVDKVENKVVPDKECDIETKPVTSVRCTDVPNC